jgi:hypothetical protein
MSHIASGFCVNNVEILKKVVNQTCPQLELVRNSGYRTWVTDRDSLAGDYPLAPVYQLILLNELRKKGIDINQLCNSVGYELPVNWVDMEFNPWNITQQNKLMQNEEFKKEYRRIESQVISKDSEYVIRYKPELNKSLSYEIGLVKHPIRNEYIMMTDYWNNGYGLFDAQGLGGVTQKEGKVEWGGTLKAAYSNAVAEHTVQEVLNANPNYTSYEKVTLPNGTTQYKINVN